MAKKLMLVLILAALVAGGAFAEPNTWGGKKNHMSGDLGLLFGGVRYERFLTPNWSIGGDFYWANSLFIYNELEAGAFGRWYPWKGLYAELGLGFHIHTGTEAFEVESGGFKFSGDGLVTTTGVAITPGVGYKFDPGKSGGFFIEPGVLIPITIGKKTGQPVLWASKDPFDLGVGVSVGFNVYCGLGWAF
jgi:hypothetical protein